MAQQSGPLTECPKSPDSLHFATWWYQLAAVPGFLVCTKCHAEKIAHTQFASNFQSLYYTPTLAKPATCFFNNPTVESIFNHSLQYPNSFPIFLDYARARVTAHHCPGMDGIAGGQGVNWWGIRQIPDFMVCGACYLEFVKNSNFGNNFTPYPKQQRPDDTWACDMAIPMVRRHMIQDSRRSDWSAFVNASSHRLSLPRCDATEKSLARTNWYTPKGVKNVLICETCYLDEISLQPSGIASQFCELRSTWMSTPPASITGRCAMSKLCVQICTNQLLEKDFNKWRELVAIIMDLPQTCGQKLDNATWYCLANPWTGEATDFGFCFGCYQGICKSANIDHMFRAVMIPGAGYCECAPDNPRLGESVKVLTEMLFTRDTSKLVNYSVGLQQQSSFGPVAPNMPQQYAQAQQQQYTQPQHQQQSQPQQSQSQQQQRPTQGSSDWQKISQQMAAQHQMNMGMMNMNFASNSMHNAAMSGIANYGSAYNSYHDPTYTSAQASYSAAQNQMFSGMMGKR